MFCRNCGAEINDTAKFCPKCGNARTGEQVQKKEIIEDNNVRLTLKPEFNMLYQFLSAVWNGILVLFLIAYCITGIELFIYYPIIPTGFLAIYILIKMVVGNMQYKSLKYNFYATKVEYIDGFLNKEEKELKYKFIREVTMTRSILERICGIGTIKVFTNASSGGYGGGNHNNMKGRNGILIHCIANVEEQYRIVKQIIDEGTPEEE